MGQLHGEIVPDQHDQFFGYIFHDLTELRTRRDGRLLVGLCLDQNRKVILTLCDEVTGLKLTEPIEPGVANQAFEQPFVFVSTPAQNLIKQALNPQIDDGPEII